MTPTKEIIEEFEKKMESQVDFGGFWWKNGNLNVDAVKFFLEDALTSQQEELKEFKKILGKKLIAIVSNDKTPDYGYSHDVDERYLNILEEKPPVGEKWKTPTELVQDILKEFE